MMTMVRKATVTFLTSPKVGVTPGVPPPAQRIATGSSEMPMMVMTTPVTTSGKKRSRLVKTGAMRKPMIPESSRAPRMARRPTVPPPSAAPMASMVDTAANDVPWTIG